MAEWLAVWRPTLDDAAFVDEPAASPARVSARIAAGIAARIAARRIAARRRRRIAARIAVARPVGGSLVVWPRKPEIRAVGGWGDRELA